MTNKTSKYPFLSLAFILILASLTAPLHHERSDFSGMARQSAEAEMRVKQQRVARDIEVTDLLCRSQCRADVQRAMEPLFKTGDMNVPIQNILKETMAKHPHIRYMKWHGNPQAELYANTAALPRLVLVHIKKAEQSERYYESPRIEAAGENYFILHMPVSGSKRALTAVIQQNILGEVNIQQRKNLRIVPYPSDRRPGIQAAESDTWRRVRVRNAEQNEDTSHYRKNEIVVKFVVKPSDVHMQRIRSDINAIHIRKLGYTYIFRSRTMSSRQMIKYFKQNYAIEYAEPHFLYMTNERRPYAARNSGESADSAPNDELYAQYQWNLPVISAEQGWNITKGQADVVVAVLDTGVDATHPDLRTNLVIGYNALDESSRSNDDFGHGTHVAGIIAAEVNNYQGIAGISWHNKIMPVKVLDDTGAGSTYAVAQGIIWAVDHGAKVINMSLGNYAKARFLHDAIRYAFDKDVVLVAATGNDNTEDPGYPAAYPEVFAVSATDEQRGRASFSNYGDYVDVVAPGTTIASTYLNGRYAALSGTSMASPHVAALAAMIRSANPHLKNTEVMDIMRSSTVDLGAPGRDKYFGYGQIDMDQALKKAETRSDTIDLSVAQWRWSDWLQNLIKRIKGERE